MTTEMPWWTVIPESNGNGWLVSKNGRTGTRYPAGRDAEAQREADRRNNTQRGAV